MPRGNPFATQRTTPLRAATSVPLAAGHIPSLDGLRAIAVVIVIWGHAELPMVIRGSTGVTIFFFLSGYLITTLLRREADKRGRISVRDFYLRRVFRIFPPLYVVLAIAIVLSATGVIANAMTGWGIASSATFFTNYFIIFDGRDGLPGGMNALWSLAVEEHYYLVFPLLYIALRRLLPNRMHQGAVLVAICLAIMAWRFVLTAQDAGYDRIYLATDTRADAILWGAVLAIVANPAMGDLPRPRRSWPLTVLLLVCAAVFWLVNRAPDSFGMTAGYTIQSVVLAGVFVPLILIPQSVLGRLVNLRPVAYLGVLSYGLYLIHRPVLIVAENVFALPHVVEVAIGVIVSVLLAVLLRVLVEKPFEQVRKRLRPSAAPAPDRQSTAA